MALAGVADRSDLDILLLVRQSSSKKMTALFTVHNTGVENVALVHDARLPWVVRKGGQLPTIVGRYGTQEEADCACLAANHAVKEAADVRV